MTIKRVLVVHPYGLGDFLFVTPVLRALRLLPGVEKVDLLLGSRTAEVVRENPHVDEIFVVDKGRYQKQSKWQTFSEVIALGRQLRRRRYDLILDYSLRSEYALLGRFGLGVSRVAGFNYKRRGFFHSIRYALPQGFSGRPAMDIYAELAERAGVVTEDRFMELYLNDDARAEAFKKWKEKTACLDWGRFICVSPGGGESWGKDAHFKQWPAASFAELLTRLHREGAFETVVILGSPAEKNLAEALSSKLTVPAVNLCGELSILGTCAMLERAAAFVGNDGGLVHMAHALRIPLIALFGPVDPRVYGPHPASPKALAVYQKDLACRPCYVRFRYNSACETRECLQALTSDEVWRQIEESGWLQAALVLKEKEKSEK